MKNISALCTTCLMALTFASTGYAHGDIKCAAIPQSEWKPQTELQQKLTKEGWKVRQIKSYRGCYEVYGFDANGARAEAFFNPGNLERVDKKK